MSRKWNFYAGPSTLPLEVLTELRDTMVDYHNEGLSLIETSHRSPEYDAVHYQAMDLVRELLEVPANYKILFLGGGATLQFAMVPLNLLTGDKICDYALTGSWAKSAYKDAAKLGQARAAFDGSPSGFTTLPVNGGGSGPALEASPSSSYLHITSNETIGGLQYKTWPVPAQGSQVPLVADMSSDIMSRKIPVEKFGLIYGGAQKNLGPAGVTLVIIREDLLERSPESLPAYLSYRVHGEKDSLYNTPPVFALYGVKLVLEWLKKNGGLAAAQERNEEKAGLIYGRIDRYPEIYRCPVEKAARSLMNIVFTLDTPEREKEFLGGAGERGMLGLKGHRSVGGCRASVYNGMPLAGARALADYMDDFAAKGGKT
ncbi:MAG: 3-phosphoserine/phosphohydroxythreonine transaminase [Spirochaetales bacterium]|jgi:phosphoserine aminotransferase|nr:3-phosphoserine/phosphohydroxythreonine transaminase [Spirochaetales bacterium]